MTSSEIVTLLVWYVVFLFSTTLHEASHAWAAMRGGDLTAYHGGQVSIDPIPHIRREPFGMLLLPALTLFFAGWPLGFASCPYDPDWARRYPKRAGWMALAGPAANLAIVLVVTGLIWIGSWTGHFAPPSDRFGLDGLVAAGAQAGPVWKGLAGFASIFFAMNFILFIFNLIPVPPLDGGGGINLLLGDETAVRYQNFMNQPLIGLIGILVAWRIFDYLIDLALPVGLRLLHLPSL